MYVREDNYDCSKILIYTFMLLFQFPTNPPKDISPQDVREVPTTSPTNPTPTIIRRNDSLNNRDRPRPILKQRPLSDYSCYSDFERVQAESSDGLSGLDRGVKRSATFSGRRRVSIDLCEFVVCSGSFLEYL